MSSEVLLSLDDDLKGLSEILGSKSSKNILGELALNDLSVSEIAQRLDMKINTVDYNVRKLVNAELIESVSHWWSVKGRKMIIYRASNKRIVIYPKKKVAKNFAWVLGLTGALSLFLRYSIFASHKVVLDSAVPKVEMLAVNAGVGDTVVETVGNVGFWVTLAGWEWFLIGAWVSVFLFFVYSMVSGRRGRR